MIDPTKTPTPDVDSRLTELQVEVQSLRGFLWQCLLGTLLAFLGLGAFFGIQAWQSGKELESRNLLYQQVQLEEAKFDAVVEQLRRFAVSHPDFVPVLQRAGVEPLEKTNSVSGKAAKK